MVMMAVAAFLAASLAVLGGYELVHARRLKVLDRLQRYSGLVPTAGEMALEGPPDMPPLQSSGWRQALDGVAPVRRYLQGLEKELSRTTILLRPEEFALGALGTALGLWLLLFWLGTHLFLQLAGAALGYFLWIAALRRSQRRRLRAFNNQLVEVLGMIVNGLRAGYSFMQAAEMVAAESNPPMSVEFQRLVKDTGMGVTTETALQDLSQRVGSEDMDLVVTAILIQRQVGGNLAELLEQISYTIRERIKLQRELRTLTSQQRLSGLIIMLLPPGLALIIFLMNPEFLEPLYLEPLGRLLLVVAASMQIIGILLIRRIMSIEV